MNLPLFRPAIALMNRLKYPQKFALISLVFAMPLTLAMYLLLSEINSRIDFAQKELYGSQYLRPLNKLWQYALSNQPVSQIRSSDPIDDRLLQDLANRDRNLDEKLRSTEKFKLLEQSWQNLHRQDNPKDREVYRQLSDRIDKLRAHVGDTSNLILDPDLDTYYLMDSSLLKLPAMQRALAEVKLMSLKIGDRRQITSEERGRLIELSGLLKEQASDLSRNLNTAFTNNPASNLRAKLSRPLKLFLDNSQQLSDVLDELTEPNTQLFASTSVLVKTNFDQSFALWDQIVDELDFLLQRRIDGFRQRQLFGSIFVLITLLIVVYLFIAFYLAVMKTVQDLDVVAKRMTSGAADEEIQNITLDTQDELGQVVESFNRIATALVSASLEINLLNERLRVDNLRMSSELGISHELQQMLLPREEELKKIKNLDIAGFMEPATEVGGDYYDVLMVGDRVKIGIGDVTGHGLESSAIMIMVQTAVRTLLIHNETDPVKFLNTLNRTIYDNVQRMNSDKNLSLALLDYHDGKLTLSGQHEEMIVVRANGTVERLDTIDLGFPIGLEADITDFIDRAHVQLNLGDVVVLYTDGITEADNIRQEQYGLDRLCEVISQNIEKTSAEIRQAVIKDVRSHIGEQRVYDDITLVVMKQK
ncbi:PP2C family protein-serine/threonine phosphatase [Tumidithrix helvetica PCC 7403]